MSEMLRLVDMPQTLLLQPVEDPDVRILGVRSEFEVMELVRYRSGDSDVVRAVGCGLLFCRPGIGAHLRDVIAVIVVDFDLRPLGDSLLRQREGSQVKHESYLEEIHNEHLLAPDAAEKTTAIHRICKHRAEIRSHFKVAVRRAERLRE